MALSASEQRAMAKAVELGGAARVRRLSYGHYEVPSATQAGTTYHVSVNGQQYTCNCPAGEVGRPCWHQASVFIAKVEHLSGAIVTGPAPVPAGEQPAPKPRTARPRRVRGGDVVDVVAGFERQAARVATAS